MTRPLSQPRRRGAARIWRGLAMIAVAGAVLVAWLSIDGRIDVPTGVAADPAASEAAASVPARPAQAFALTVDRVFDGDTILARIAAPNDVVPTADPVRIRLIGIDTPEGTPSPECWADEAREHLRALLPEGSTVWAVPDLEWRDRHDRALLYLWTDAGRFVNHELVAAGDAEAMLVEPNGAHFALFTAAEESARIAGIGQWGACR